jgi:hypothetical protein
MMTGIDIGFFAFATIVVGVACILIIRDKPYRQTERKPVEPKEE